MRHSVEPKDRTYVKGYRFSSFAKNVSIKYNQKPLGRAKKSTTVVIKAA